MAPNDDSKPRRAPPSTTAAAQAARAKRKRAAAAEEGGASSGDERARGGKAAKVASAGTAAGAASSRTALAATASAASGSKQPVVPTPEEERITKLDFNAFPATSLRAYILANGLMPRLEPSPYADEPAPLPETLYRDTSAVPAPQPGEAYPPPKRVAILADVQATHEVLSKHAKDHWHKTQGNGPREGEVVTGFLYACKVGDRVLKIVPPSN